MKNEFESSMPTQIEGVEVIDRLDVKNCPKGQISRYWLKLINDGMGHPINLPLIVAKGANDGPVLGLTAAVHGNELNGIPVIQRLFQDINVEELNGTIVGVPVVNIPSLLRKKRHFPDGKDLNHVMPGKQDGNASAVYAFRLMDRVINQFQFLMDLHTASFGRINSYYIRADMSDPKTARMANLQNADLIVHNPPSDGTLRGAASEMGIRAITLEVGDPNRFQRGMIRSGLTGIHNVLIDFEMMPGELEIPSTSSVMCEGSAWVYTDMGGMLVVLPEVTQLVTKGSVIARQTNIFGDVIKEYLAPSDGIVIGKSVNPVAPSGARILHLGKVFQSGNGKIFG